MLRAARRHNQQTKRDVSGRDVPLGWLTSILLVIGVLGTAVAEQGLLEQLQDRAKQGLADAQNELGNLLYDQQNFVEAIEWYKLAAGQGHADALNNLGVMHYFGEGVMQSYSDSARLYRKAAEKGHLHAQMNLAFMLLAGEGIPANYIESYAWYSVADRQGVFEAKDAAMSLSTLLTRTQLLRAQDLAQRYWKDYVLPFQQD